jgi:hypothetical protein
VVGEKREGNLTGGGKSNNPDRQIKVQTVS